MKIIYCAIWLSYGLPPVYMKAIQSFLNNAEPSELWIFIDSQIKLDEDHAKDIKQCFDSLEKFPAIKIVDIQELNGVKDHSYYNWIVKNEGKLKKTNLAAAVDCLRFVVVDYLLKTQNVDGVFFFEADVFLQKKIDLKDLKIQPRNQLTNNNNETKEIYLNNTDKIISFNYDNENLKYYAVFFPQSAKEAVDHVVKTYHNIYTYILDKKITMPCSNWKLFDEDPNTTHELYLRSLLYTKNWKFSEVMLDIDSDFNKLIKDQLYDLYGVELPDKVPEFGKKLLRSGDLNAELFSHMKNDFWFQEDNLELRLHEKNPNFESIKNVAFEEHDYEGMTSDDYEGLEIIREGSNKFDSSLNNTNNNNTKEEVPIKKLDGDFAEKMSSFKKNNLIINEKITEIKLNNDNDLMPVIPNTKKNIHTLKPEVINEEEKSNVLSKKRYSKEEIKKDRHIYILTRNRTLRLFSMEIEIISKIKGIDLSKIEELKQKSEKLSEEKYPPRKEFYQDMINLSENISKFLETKEGCDVYPLRDFVIRILMNTPEELFEEFLGEYKKDLRALFGLDSNNVDFSKPQISDKKNKFSSLFEKNIWSKNKSNKKLPNDGKATVKHEDVKDSKESDQEASQFGKK